MQRYEKVRAEANGKRSFRHRRPRNGPRTAVCLSSRRRSCLPPGPPRPSSVPASCPARYLPLCLPYPARPIRRPARSHSVASVAAGYASSTARSCTARSCSVRRLPRCPPRRVRCLSPPSARRLSVADPCPVLSAARSSLSPFLRPAVPFCPPPFLSVPFVRPAPREGPGRIFCRYFIILQEFYTFAKRKNKIQKACTYGKSL